MKWLIRMFFRTVRRILGPIMLLIDKITSPKGVERPAAEQQQLDQITQNMALYQFRTCPFCMKVRHEIKRQSLNIEIRDAQYDQQHRQQLLNGGGQIKVPCLQVVNEDGNHTWLYESNEVIDYLRKLVA
ncbi:MAG: glutathione S-transferase N-terminal domain-containing protein [Thioalkalispiraceae bacterium]